MIDQLLGLTLVLGGGYLVFQAMRHHRILHQTRQWNKAMGLMLHSKTPERSLRGEAEFVYEYRVGERVFRNAAICPVGERRRGRTAWRRCQLYPESSHVVVTFDPKDPQRSFVEHRVDRLPIASLAGTIFAFIGIVVLVSL